MIVYIARTERGRVAQERSLLEAVQSIAVTCGRNPGRVVTAYVTEIGFSGWLVYPDQRTLDIDLLRSKYGLTLRSPGWFATVQEVKS